MKQDTSAEAAAAPDEGSCSYKSRKCTNPRAVKRNGRMHTLCEYHRARQNEHQRKSDRKHKGTKHVRHLMKQCGAIEEHDTPTHLHHLDTPLHHKMCPAMSMHVTCVDAPFPSSAPDGFLYGNLHKDLSFVEAFELREALRAVTASPGLM